VLETTPRYATRPGETSATAGAQPVDQEEERHGEVHRALTVDIG
jgi:hypothetical protein